MFAGLGCSFVSSRAVVFGTGLGRVWDRSWACLGQVGGVEVLGQGLDDSRGEVDDEEEYLRAGVRSPSAQI